MNEKQSKATERIAELRAMACNQGHPLRDKLIAGEVHALIDCAEALRPLLERAMSSVCQHEETHRGGAIWEICDACGSKWADDEGGKPEWVDPPEWTAALAALRALNGDDR